MVAVFGLSAACFSSAGAAPTARSVNVQVRCLDCAQPYSQRLMAQINAMNNAMVQLPGAGKYEITYADGPLKGQVIKTVKATKAESVSCKVDARYGGMQFSSPK